MPVRSLVTKWTASASLFSGGMNSVSFFLTQLLFSSDAKSSAVFCGYLCSIDPALNLTRLTVLWFFPPIISVVTIPIQYYLLRYPGCSGTITLFLAGLTRHMFVAYCLHFPLILRLNFQFQHCPLASSLLQATYHSVQCPFLECRLGYACHVPNISEPASLSAFAVMPSSVPVPRICALQ